MRSEDLYLLGVEENEAGGDDVEGESQDVVNRSEELKLEEGDGQVEEENGEDVWETGYTHHPNIFFAEDLSQLEREGAVVVGLI